VLSNPVVLGDAVHKGVAYPGEHPPIVDRKLWDEVRSIAISRAIMPGASPGARIAF
jgi:hypothetical protein